MRLTKLDFIGRIGDGAFTFLLEAAKTSVEIEKFVKMVDWATPDPDGTSIDTNDPRVQAIRALEPMLIAQGKVAAGWADAVLADATPVQEQPAPDPLPTGMAKVYRIGENYMTCLASEPAPEIFDESWEISALYYALIAEGATVRSDGGKLAIARLVE